MNAARVDALIAFYGLNVPQGPQLDPRRSTLGQAIGLVAALLETNKLPLRCEQLLKIYGDNVSIARMFVGLSDIAKDYLYYASGEHAPLVPVGDYYFVSTFKNECEFEAVHEQSRDKITVKYSHSDDNNLGISWYKTDGLKCAHNLKIKLPVLSEFFITFSYMEPEFEASLDERSDQELECASLWAEWGMVACIQTDKSRHFSIATSESKHDHGGPCFKLEEGELALVGYKLPFRKAIIPGPLLKAKC